MNPHDPRGNGPYGGSDTSSFYSVRSGSTGSDSEDSTLSFWTSSDSQSFVYTDDPRGFFGVRGAVTRKADKRDDRRVRMAAHILSGPFAQCSKALYSKRHGRYYADREAAPSYCEGSRSSSSSSSPEGRKHHGGGHHHHHHHHHNHRGGQQRPDQAHHGFHGPPPQPMHHHGGPPPCGPPPPPPPQQQHPATAGFENGFIQIPTAPGRRGPAALPRPAERDDAAWGRNGRRHDVEVFD